MTMPASQPPAGGPSPWQWHLPETYKGLIALSVEALKILGLVNGGAAVALLTYAGNHSSSVPAANLRSALLWYCGGVFAVTLAFVVAYATQLRLYVEERRKASGLTTRELHGVGIGLGMVLALGAAVAFVGGCLSAATALALS